MYLLTAYAIFAPASWQPMLGSINAISIIILIIYVILLIKQPKESDDEEEKKETESKLTVKQIIILFIVFSVLLIAASILITYTTDLITKEVPWLGGTVAGAILLGVATSLPEVISTFQLFKIKIYNAGYGNMIGSCTFNFSILSLVDFISWTYWNGDIVADRGIFIANNDSRQLVVFGLITIVATGILLYLKLFTKVYEKKKIGFIVCSVLTAISLASYLLVFIL